MITDITLAKETKLFLMSLGMGVVLSLCYDVLRLLRIQVHHKKSTVFAEDILYFLGSAFFTFLFLLKYHYGQVRGYVLIGEGLGWVIWHMTLGEVAVKILSVILTLLRKLIRLILAPFRLAFKVLVKTFLRLGNFCKNFLKKVVQKKK